MNTPDSTSSNSPQSFDAGDSEEMIVRAREIATVAHAGQVDKAGKPYIEHPARVAASLNDPHAIAAAWLHDVVEDTSTTLSSLGAEFPEAVVLAVDALTRRPDRSSTSYYERIRANPIALAVKLADIADNSEPGRLSALPSETQTRLIAKYSEAIELLTPTTVEPPDAKGT